MRRYAIRNVVVVSVLLVISAIHIIKSFPHMVSMMAVVPLFGDLKEYDGTWNAHEEPRDHHLYNISLRYYLYTDPNITQDDTIRPILDPGYNRHAKARKRFIEAAIVEYEVLQVLHNHSLRTFDVSTADIFIVPIAIGYHLISSFKRRGYKRQQSPLHLAFESLERQKTFKKLMGHRHVILSQTQQAFDMCSESSLRTLGMNKNLYERLANVTIAREMDAVRLAHWIRGSKGVNVSRCSLPAYFCKGPSTNSAFSLGILTDRAFPFVNATFEKFQNASNFIFYQTRAEPFAGNSTIYRHLPILAHVNEMLPKSSIGFGIKNKTERMQTFIDSKFCLCIRGDTPHSHALIRSIKVGCIPVIISDFWPNYAPTLPSTLNIHEFSIFIKEKDFLDNPARVLQSLMELSDYDIRIKMEAIRFAQQVALYDHPDSLFVEAFLKEADFAMTQQDPDLCAYHSRDAATR